MRLSRLLWPTLLAACCCWWVGVVSAWEQLDYDIFDLVDEVRKAHGDEATFYSVFNVAETAETSEIVRAHRKLSLVVHPDKNPSKEAEKVFKRLGAIAAILKDSEKRKRYEFFLKNGVPVWRGTGYYYKRHRPGLGGVLAMLAIVGSAVHYLLLYVGWWRGRTRWRLLQDELKKRKGRVPIGGHVSVVQGYVVTEDGEWPGKKPTLLSVFIIALPLWLVWRILMPKRQAPNHTDEHKDGDADAAHVSDEDGHGRATPASSQRGGSRPRRRKGNKT